MIANNAPEDDSGKLSAEEQADLKKVQAESASAHARVNIPLNLEKLKDIPDDDRREIVWFHQHMLDAKLSLKEGAEAIGYDNSTLSRVLSGIYQGSLDNIVKAIQSYKLKVERSSIQKQEFIENRITKLIFAGLS